MNPRDRAVRYRGCESTVAGPVTRATYPTPHGVLRFRVPPGRVLNLPKIGRFTEPHQSGPVDPYFAFHFFSLDSGWSTLIS